MINAQLLHPTSIVIIGGSNNTHKPGGAITRNLINGNFEGTLRIVNPNRYARSLLSQPVSARRHPREPRSNSASSTLAVNTVVRS